MPSSPSSEAFIAHDSIFVYNFAISAKLDPLGLHEDQTMPHFQGKQGDVPIEQAQIATTRLLAWQNDRLDSADEPEIRAVRRDYDKAIGSFVARKANMVAAIPETNQVFETFLAAGIKPRADFYDYSLGSIGREMTYSGDEKEAHLLNIFSSSIIAAHNGLYAVLRARHALRQSNTDALKHLEQAIEESARIQKAMADTYRQVGPDFVANEVTRYVGGVTHNAKKYEGPNASHSGFMVLDRFVYGSFESLLADNPALAKQFAYRQADLPDHLSVILDQADAEKDNQSIIELAKNNMPEATEQARQLATSLRKTKVMHKSYADKGLQAKGGSLSPDEPDVLSDTIIFTRNKEK
ncbi:MAG TPA: hypothetical protein VH144_03680 [Candidatus Saccharimonadales bacterium]|jgi:hypothetical protein|nr:hypothetical protein [Candidatus Saccharimonadales bacterium]